MKINTNVTAMRGYNHLNKINALKEKSLTALTTGKRINSASDDAAGMSISTKMKNQINGIKMGIRNCQDGQSMVLTAEGVMNEVTDILSRMRELCVEASNDTYGQNEKDAIANELTELTSELDRIADQTKFNGIKLLDGNATDITLQVGANKGETIILNFPAVDKASLGLGNIDVSDHDAASDMIETVDNALTQITTVRSTLGATINRLSYTESNLSVMLENLTSANSRIEDTDVASTMIEFTRTNILSQSGTSMLSQAMQIPNSALQLLQQ